MEKDLARIALFAALIAVLGFIPKIALGFGVPITAQSLGVMLAGAVLGSRRGALAVLLFLLVVALGLPLLAGGRGGLGPFASPSAGFLFGFPIAAFVTGVVVERLRAVRPAISASLGAFLGGIVVLYPLGTLGMAIELEKSFFEAFLLNAAYFPGDMLKVGLTGMLIAAVAKLRPHTLQWYHTAGPVTRL